MFYLFIASEDFSELGWWGFKGEFGTPEEAIEAASNAEISGWHTWQVVDATKKKIVVARGGFPGKNYLPEEAPELTTFITRLYDSRGY